MRGSSKVRLLNKTTYGDTFGKRDPFKQKSVYRFPGMGGDGQATVSAGGGYPSPVTPSLITSGISNLNVPTFQATDTWKPAENSYQSILDAMTAAQRQQTPGNQMSPNDGYMMRKGGGWGQGTGQGLGLAAYGYKGTTGLPEHRGTGMLGTQQVFSDALSAMFAEMKKAGIRPPDIGSGFRSYEGQVAAAKKYANQPGRAARPGTSLHGLGLAIDTSNLTNQAYAWMKQNAHRYNIVNLPSERWHWQFSASAWTRQNKTASASRQVRA